MSNDDQYRRAVRDRNGVSWIGPQTVAEWIESLGIFDAIWREWQLKKDTESMIAEFNRKERKNAMNDNFEAVIIDALLTEMEEQREDRELRRWLKCQTRSQRRIIRIRAQPRDDKAA